jgi:hypothetical protein
MPQPKPVCFTLPVRIPEIHVPQVHSPHLGTGHDVTRLHIFDLARRVCDTCTLTGKCTQGMHTLLRDPVMV